MQNMTYLIKLAEASVKVNWDSLPTKRKIGYNEELYRKHKALITDIKKGQFGIDVKVVGKDDKMFVVIDLDEPNMSEVYNGLIMIQNVLGRYKIPTGVIFKETYMKIELK
jgi:hypothetical protein